MELVSTYEQNAEKPPAEWTETGFRLEIPMNTWDLVKPKHCVKCKKIFFRGGKKSIRGDMRQTHLTTEYRCNHC
jgi:DNA-directed RNA polymerase subunit RPC12/RpoP